LTKLLKNKRWTFLGHGVHVGLKSGADESSCYFFVEVFLLLLRMKSNSASMTMLLFFFYTRIRSEKVIAELYNNQKYTDHLPTEYHQQLPKEIFFPSY